MVREDGGGSGVMYRWWEAQAFCISECNGGLMVLTGCSKSLPWSGVHLIVGQRRRGSQDRKCQQTQGHRQSERRISKWPGLNWRCRGIREINSSKPHTRGRGNKALWTGMGSFVIKQAYGRVSVLDGQSRRLHLGAEETI